MGDDLVLVWAKERVKHRSPHHEAVLVDALHLA